jgi:Sortilin, neurotensin receptor 3,/Sortilin, neurotensin receptor 3, C-terminal
VDITNVVVNTEMAGTGEGKKIQTRITFNAGGYWLNLKGPVSDFNNQSLCEKPDWCPLQIHLTATSQAYSGMLKPFGNPGSVGLILAVGNIGETLGDYLSGDVFLSRDAGQSWHIVKKGPHIWAMSDNGGLLVLVDSTKHVTTLSYSWDFGSSWADFQFNSNPLKVASIVAHEGSTKVFISGHTMSDIFPGAIANFVSVQLDFSALFKRPCEKSKNDFEIWSPAEPTADGKDLCFLGEVSQFLRRKLDTMCTIGPDFVSKIESKKNCECNADDFECDVGVFRDSAGKCEFGGNHPDQPAHCEKGTSFLGKSGYRKISLSRCEGGKDLSAPTDFECDPEPTGPENVKLFPTIFDRKIVDYFYFENSGSILLKDDGHRAFLSSNEGQSWIQILVDAGEIIALYNDPYIMDRAFAVTKSQLWITDNKGVDFHSVSIPNSPDLILSPDFLETHPANPERLIWIGSADCPGSNCHSVASVSWNSGKNWGNLASYVRTCKWAWSADFSLISDKAIFCAQFDAKSGDQTYANGLKLIRSIHGDSNFENLLDINGFALESEYLIAAVPLRNTKAVQLQVSMDGTQFSTATFPDKFSVKDGYTVLPSNTGNVFLHVIESLSPGAEFGTVFKSDWNGKFYHSAIQGINQNRLGFVDFEKVEGLNGTMIVNQIRNIEDVKQGQNKQLVTKMTFDDGLTWNYLTPPKFDSAKLGYNCQHNCQLHLHAFTERRDKKDSYSSPGAAGVMIGVGILFLISGNVGEYLDAYSTGDTFLSRDAGRSWIEIAKQAHMIEINDHGAIILLANDEDFVTSVKYSLDVGATFRDVELKVPEGQSIRIQHIITEPTGTTKNFVVIGNLKNGSAAAINLDFDHVFTRQCEVNTEEATLSDFEEWTPNTNDSCTFGSKVQFLRRKIDRDCYVGDVYKKLEPKSSPCSCTIADYECDQYHILNSDNQCVGAESIQIPEPPCRNGVKYIPTGYIKKKISQCEGGKLLAPKPSICSRKSFLTIVLCSLSWPLIVFVLLPITVFAIYLLFRFMKGDLGRYGAISLPIENSPQSSIRGRMLAVAQDFIYGLSGFFGGLWSRASDYLRRSDGYAPVSTHYYDPDLPTNGSLELDWDDHENI